MASLRACVFANGQCEIYEDRPIDGRLFPVDIREERDGTLVWIVYTRLCPAGLEVLQL